MLPVINKVNIVGIEEVIEEYLGSCFGVKKAPLAYIIRKAIVLESYGCYPWYEPLDYELIVRMFHLPIELIRIYNGN